MSTSDDPTPAPPPKGKRPASEKRRQQLAEIAGKLICERGFKSLSINDFAGDAGISVGGIYRYIKTKSDLLVMVCEDIYGDLRERILEVALGEQRIPEKLRDAMRIYLNSCDEVSDLILLMYREYRHLPAEAKSRYREREEAIAGVFSDLIVAGIRQGLFGKVNADVIARDIVFLGHMPALKGWSLRGRASHAQISQEQIDLILGRLAPSATQTSGSGP
jgi:TetR/AcrR family transcriptional regulator, cholesterol catabolism regulator